MVTLIVLFPHDELIVIVPDLLLPLAYWTVYEMVPLPVTVVETGVIDEMSPVREAVRTVLLALATVTTEMVCGLAFFGSINVPGADTVQGTGVGDGVGVAVGTGVAVGEGVGVGVAVGVGVGVGVGVAVSDGSGVGVGLADGSSTGVGLG